MDPTNNRFYREPDDTNTPETLAMLADLLLFELNRTRPFDEYALPHYDIAVAILDKFELTAKPEPLQEWREYDAWARHAPRTIKEDS